MKLQLGRSLLLAIIICAPAHGMIEPKKYSPLISSDDEQPQEDVDAMPYEYTLYRTTSNYSSESEVSDTESQDERALFKLKQRLVLEELHLATLKSNFKNVLDNLEHEQKNLFEKKMFFLGLSQIPYYWSRFLIDLTQMSYVSVHTRGTAVLNMMSDMVLGIGSVIFTQENTTFKSVQFCARPPAATPANETTHLLPNNAQSVLENEHTLPENDLV